MSVKKSKDPARKAKLAAWLNNPQKPPIRKEISPMPEGVPKPLSYGQERLYFLQELAPENPQYHFSEIFFLEGSLDYGLLQNAFLALLKRHDILRTCFCFEQGILQQKIHPHSELPWTFFDLSGLGKEFDENAASSLVKKEVRKPFKLEEGPLFRVLLLKVKENSHWLVLTFHHIIVDEQSIRILLHDLAQHYQNPSRSLETFPKSDLQYADFAYWQRKQSISSNTEAYWKEQLSGELPVLSLPFDFPRPPIRNHSGAYSQRRLPNSVKQSVQALTKSLETTPFVFFLTLYNMLLYRYSYLDDIRVGTPFSNRDFPALEKVMGFFNETQVIRTHIRKNLGVKDLIKQVKKTVLEAFNHKNMPFESLVSSINPERVPGVNPVFQAMFLYHESHPAEDLSPSLEITQQHFDFGVTKFDLTLMLAEEEDGLLILFEYATELFSEATIDRFHDSFETILNAVLEDPNQEIGQLPILTESEQAILGTYSLGPKITRSSSTVVELISAHIVKRPHAIAAKFQEETLTYADLGEKSELLATHLLSQGVAQNSFVGLCSNPSVDLVVGILGILRAGAAYVPLDPSYPQDRIQGMVEDADVEYVVMQSQLIDKFLPANVEVIDLEQVISGKDPGTALSIRPIGGENLAYAIFTSGSSGRPKGVPISHENLLNSTLARTEFYQQDPSTFLLLSSFSFDSSVAGIFWTLCSGGTLLLAEKRIEQDIEKLGNEICRNQVSHTLMLPSLYALVLRHSPPDLLRSLQTVIVAGEASTPELIEQHFNSLPNTELFNEYGPTEATVWSTGYKFLKHDHKGNIPIGKPISNMEVLVLDQHMKPVPIGVKGELYIGGIGLAKSYLKRPQLSQERFIPHPFHKEKSASVYKTGDLVSFRHDGNLIFHGRTDDQIKIRGFRVELEEIRNRLQQIPEVEESWIYPYVENKGSIPERKFLIAYFTSPQNLNTQDIRSELMRRLPDYMVPSEFIQLSEVPKLPNGKINFKALPTPVLGTQGPRTHYAAPRTPIERELVRIWEKVLGIHPIGIDQNFFQLGGDSLMSIQLIAEARKAGIPLAAKDIFEYQEITSLAKLLRPQQDPKDSSDSPLSDAATPIQEWSINPEDLNTILAQLDKS